MSKEALQRLLGALQQKQGMQDASVAFPRNGYKPISFSRQHFRSISALQEEKEVWYVDGGNGEIFHSPSCSVQFLRLCAIHYQGKQRQRIAMKECFLLIQPEERDGEMVYAMQHFPVQGNWKWETDSFALDDPELQEGLFRPNIVKIGNILRRIAEIQFAGELLAGRKNCAIIFDGILQAGSKAEQEQFSKLFTMAEEHNCIVAALAKTTNLFTNAGNTVGMALQKLAPEGAWWYSPVAEITHPYHYAEMAFVKLHPFSRHIFRFEWQKGKQAEKLLESIAAMSHDLVFPGYPYPLIAADQFARISHREIGFLQTEFMALAGKQWQALEGMQNSANAHTILDRLGQ
ncbi:DNA double-strand break repair nuclease NurA [Candidatus Woesearchaeota archaeon]|nr:DNA double-strand break repair nuclease NurA [Candidatus Woesearchaeota archaeon]